MMGTPDACRCQAGRQLQQSLEEEEEPVTVWKVVYVSAVLFAMLITLVSDRFGADHVMVMALTAFLAADIISIEEALRGFANPGLWTILVLFVVAQGISKTGALDWYMTKALGSPKTVTGAQLRLMIPIATVSAFLNNTPTVAVMIPIVIRWAKNCRLSPQQLLIPLSFASILGGTCTLIGTSTNLVVAGLLEDRYPGAETIGLFSLGQFGVPVALAGLAYVIFASKWLLPGTSAFQADEDSAILLGARLTQWSPAAGRTVQRSGLRDSGGIFLVSVHRAATGNVHRAVSRDFVLNIGDTLYFTGLVESFGEFCEEHGLEVVTNETIQGERNEVSYQVSETSINHVPKLLNESDLSTVHEEESVPVQVGITRESILQTDEEERLRVIHRMTDFVRGGKYNELFGTEPSKIVVAADNDLVVVGIDTKDRPGLLLDISKGLLRLGLQLRHTEAAVAIDRSVSIWRCEVINTDLPDLDQIWSVMNALLSEEHGVEAMKKRGLRVIRARVLKGSRLLGRTASEVDFRRVFKGAIVTVLNGKQRPGSNSPGATPFSAGDVLIIQTSDDSPLLKRPPSSFYDDLHESQREDMTKSNSVLSLVNMVRRGKQSDLDDSSSRHAPSSISNSFINDDNYDNNEDQDDFFHPEDSTDEELGRPVTGDDTRKSDSDEQESIWRDLEVLFLDEAIGKADREFLTAMSIASKSKFVGKTASQIGIHKLPDLFLVSIDRPQRLYDRKTKSSLVSATHDVVSVNMSEPSDLDESTTRSELFAAVTQEEPLRVGDVLWFSGSAAAVGDLRKIPGLELYEADEVGKINEKVFDRRLVQAVVARQSELVGKTVREMRFRSRFGAAVIAVHREGKRVHEHPGKVKLQSGDVLLLEAGPSFLEKSAQTSRAFALLAEVENSAPPRLRLLIPALLITASMLIVFSAGITSLLLSGLVAAVLMVAVGILSEQEAREAINWEIYITIAAAFGIGIALVNSGVAGSLATLLVDVGTRVGLGDAGLLGSVYFATFLISNVVTNNAAAALIFPIAMEAAESTDTDRILMSYTVMLGASASFMSPFGYTTNLLIYGPGGYKYRDFLVFGTPMQVFLWLLSVVILSFARPWYLSWLGSLVTLVIVAVWRLGGVTLSPETSDDNESLTKVETNQSMWMKEFNDLEEAEVEESERQGEGRRSVVYVD